MNYFSTWGEAMQASFQTIWMKFVGVVPQIIAAILIFLVGIVIAVALGDIVKRLISLTKIDLLLEKTGIKQKLDSIDFKFTISGIIGWIVKWFFIIVTLIAVVEVIHLDQVSVFLRQVALYIPNVVVAIIILAIGVALSQFVYDLVQKSVSASKLPTTAANSLAIIAKWAIIIFALLVALNQLKVGSNLIQILFVGIIAGLALAFGLAFGLGGKDQASRWLDRIEKEVLNRKKEE